MYHQEPKPEEAKDEGNLKCKEPIFTATQILEWSVPWDKIELSTTAKKAYDSSFTNAIFGQFINTDTWHLHLDQVGAKISDVTQVFHATRETTLLTTNIRSESDNVILAVQSIMPPILELLRLIFPLFEFRLESEDSTESIVMEGGGIRKVKSRIHTTVYARFLSEVESEKMEVESWETEGWEPVLLLELKSPGVLHRKDWESAMFVPRGDMEFYETRHQYRRFEMSGNALIIAAQLRKYYVIRIDTQKSFVMMA